MLESLDVAVAERGLFFFFSRFSPPSAVRNFFLSRLFSFSLPPPLFLTCFPCLRSQEANLGSDSSMASAKALCLQSSRWKGQWDWRLERRERERDGERGERER